MRDYGKVHTSFWSSDTLAGLPDDGKFLALYLLTCAHGNMAGVFRLPIGYVIEDTGWTSERLNNGFETLSEAGWIRRCQRTGWTWIRNWSRWNKADNPNQQKSIDKLVDQVPSTVPFHAELMSPSKVSETVVQPLGNTTVPVTASVTAQEEQAVAEIPLEDGTNFAAPADLLAELRIAYPRLNLATEFGKARVWCVANPTQRKTRRGVAKFLNAWMGRAAKQLPTVIPDAPPAGGRRKLG